MHMLRNTWLRKRRRRNLVSKFSALKKKQHQAVLVPKGFNFSCMKIQFMSKTFCRVPVTAHWVFVLHLSSPLKATVEKALHSIDFINMWAWTPIVSQLATCDVFLWRGPFGSKAVWHIWKATLNKLLHKGEWEVFSHVKTSYPFLTSVGLMCYAWEIFLVWYGRRIVYVCVLVCVSVYLFKIYFQED